MGQGQVKPRDAKVKSILKYPVHTTKKQLNMRYGRLLQKVLSKLNIVDIVSPLTNLLSKKAKFKWSKRCQKAFDRVKTEVIHAPVLMKL